MRTSKDRQKQFRQSQKAKGLVELRGVWCEEQDRAKIRLIAQAAANQFSGDRQLSKDKKTRQIN